MADPVSTAKSASAPVDRSDRPTSEPWMFVPTFCPRSSCRTHRPQHEGAFRCTRWGWYRRKAPPGRIPRFRCRTCRRTFSSQTFSPTYYLKRPELLATVARILVNAGCDRHGRRIVGANALYADHPDAGAAGSTITRLAPRLGRHAALVLAELSGQLAKTPALDETLVADAFETFAAQQLNAVSVPTVVGARSAWIYALDQAAHPRAGRLTPAQADVAQALRAAGKLPSRSARRQAWDRVIDRLLALRADAHPLRIVSDADATIARAIAFRRAQGARLEHVAFPNPPRRAKGRPRTAEAIARDSALHEVDQLHKWFRHSMAHDRRETIAFARSVNALLSRKLLFALNRNLVQPRRERRRRQGTPAMVLGLLPRPLSWHEILEKRRFLARCPPLPPGWADAYFERIPTLGIQPSQRRLPRCHRFA